MRSTAKRCIAFVHFSKPINTRLLTRATTFNISVKTCFCCQAGDSNEYGFHTSALRVRLTFGIFTHKGVERNVDLVHNLREKRVNSSSELPSDDLEMIMVF